MNFMSTLTFDTLKFANRLKAAGMDPRLAEEQAEALVEVLDEHHKALATREYLDAKLTATAADIKTDLIKWVAGMLVAQAAVVATLVKLL